MIGVPDIEAVRRVGLVNAEGISPDPCALAVREAVSAVLERFERRLRAVVLTGSAARGEATFVKRSGGWKSLGDCEFVLAFTPGKALANSAELVDVQREIRLRLKRRSIACRVGLSPVHPSYFVRLGPHIYGYELRRCGRVLWGDRNILARIPQWAPRDIPREDAWCLLCNRMIEQLAIVCGIAHQAPGLPPQSDYRSVKLCLDLATSLLVFCGDYAPTYRERSDRLMQLAERSSPTAGLPFPLAPFAELVQRLTDWKLSPTSVAVDAGPLLRPTVWSYTRRLWRWELLQMTGLPTDMPNSGLMRHWMRRQPLHRRLRGWASLAHRHGWFTSCREWARWARLALIASPRYWIYAAGTELFFRLPSLNEEGEVTIADDSVGAWHECLPVRSEGSRRLKISGRELAAGIIRNYQQFLMETSS